jgi:ABC-type nickel/cobalt efflux system permease component RcnA
MNRFNRLLAIGLVVIAVLCLWPQRAEAHPLGNFTINRYSRIEIYSNQVRVRYVLDMAEIPAFQEIVQIDLDHDGIVSAAEGDRYREQKFAAIGRGLTLEINGARSELRALSSELDFPPGQGDLKTIRLSGWFVAAFSGQIEQSARLHFSDTNYADRIGWKEIVATSGDGIALGESSVPARDQSDELRRYPQEMLSSPLDRREALVAFQVIALSSQQPPLPARGAADVIRAGDPFAQLVGVQTLSPAVILFSLLAAAFWGALHAFSPGHGKSVVAAYLVGSRGTARHAVYLGLTVTATHTIGVYALGFVTLLAAQYILPERLYPVLGIVSGLIVILIGAVLFVARLRGADHHLHQHSDHSHALAHSHGAHAHEHPHLQAPATRRKPLDMRGLLALGISGGLIPCPSALVVMLAAIALHRLEFGLILIVAFSLGLALVLTATGLLLVWAGRIFKRLPLDNRFIRLVPAGSALLMTLAGIAITAQSAMQMWG